MIDTHTLADYLDAGSRRPVVVNQIDEIAKTVAEASGLVLRFPNHDHTCVKDDTAAAEDTGKQFILQEAFEPPADPAGLYVVVRNALSRVNRSLYYLTFTASHAWRFDDELGFPAHLRWGFAVETGKDKTPTLRKVFEHLRRERLAHMPWLVAFDACPVPGFSKPEKDARARPSLWLHFLGRRITADELRRDWTVDRICRAAADDLIAVSRAISI